MVVVPRGTARTYTLVCCLLGGGWLLFALYAYPGYMSFDSGWQLREARAGWFTDWHPPVMALIWRWLDKLWAGPLGMLVLQSGCFLIGTYLVLRSAIRPILAAALAACVLLFPPIATTLAVIWKDSLMLGLLVLAIGVSRRSRAAAVVLLVLASAMRHNAMTMTLPLVIVLCPWTRWRRFVLGTAVWLAITLAAIGSNAALTDEKAHPWHASVAMFDIVGTIRFAPPLADAELRDVLAGTRLQVEHDVQAEAIRAYNPFDGVFTILRRNFMQQPTNAAERAAIARAWRTLTLGYPLAYLRHRWHAFRELLHLPRRNVGYIWVGFDELAGFDHQPGPTQAKLQRAALWLGRSPLMHPYLYALLLLALLPMCVRARLPLALSLSAIAAELALFLISPTPDLRYSIWLVAAGVIVPILLIAARSTPRDEHHDRETGRDDRPVRVAIVRTRREEEQRRLGENSAREQRRDVAVTAAEAEQHDREHDVDPLAV